MPKCTDLQSILILGSGPIVIGQAAEFDYSGTQAVRALREEGYRVILVNSNPATIMTDPDLADATYIEPITPEWVERVIEKEKPDAILPTMGGQTALNVALELQEEHRCTPPLDFARVPSRRSLHSLWQRSSRPGWTYPTSRRHPRWSRRCSRSPTPPVTTCCTTWAPGMGAS